MHFKPHAIKATLQNFGHQEDLYHILSNINMNQMHLSITGLRGT